MRNLIVATFCIVFVMPVFADDWRNLCSHLGGFAEESMKARQRGLSMEEAMQIDDFEAKKLLEEIVIAAYEEPRFATESLQQRTIEKFRDEIYLECVKSFRDQ